jgi:hypothetical protein
MNYHHSEKRTLPVSLWQITDPRFRWITPADIYVIVKHLPSGSVFVLDRSYRLIGIGPLLALPELETDDHHAGWLPRIGAQRPDWAADHPAAEFHAYWVKDYDKINSNA